jgi:malate dehydrogenase (oxaloacetate-decarboxylating)
VLDVRARSISDGMALAAAAALQGRAGAGLGPERILPAMTEPDLAAEIAAAVGMAAQAEGLARLAKDRAALLEEARRTIGTAQAATALLMREGLIAPMPAD